MTQKLNNPFNINFTKEDEKSFKLKNKSLHLSDLQLKNLFILTNNSNDMYIKKILKRGEFLFYSSETGTFTSFEKGSYDYEGIIFYLKKFSIEFFSTKDILYLSKIIGQYTENHMIISKLVYFSSSEEELKNILNDTGIYNILYEKLPVLNKPVEIFIEKMMSFWSPLFNQLPNASIIDDYFWRKHFGYNVVDIDLFDKIYDFIEDNNVLSIMAGNGLLEYLLKLKGVDMTITTKSNDKWGIKPYSREIKILNMDYIDAINKYPTQILMVSWIPPNMNVLNIFDKFKGDKLIILGEVQGASATNDFYDKLFDEYDCEHIPVNNFYGIYNELLLCTKKGLSLRVLTNKFLQEHFGPDFYVILNNDLVNGIASLSEDDYILYGYSEDEIDKDTIIDLKTVQPYTDKHQIDIAKNIYTFKISTPKKLKFLYKK